VKWYDYAKWVLERVESFPKNQKYVLGQRLSHQVMEVLELLVEASYSREKRDLLATVNRKMEVVRWTVRMSKDRACSLPTATTTTPPTRTTMWVSALPGPRKHDAGPHGPICGGWDTAPAAVPSRGPARHPEPMGAIPPGQISQTPRRRPVGRRKPSPGQFPKIKPSSKGTK
jgi:hypothetical protein